MYASLSLWELRGGLEAAVPGVNGRLEAPSHALPSSLFREASRPPGGGEPALGESGLEARYSWRRLAFPAPKHERFSHALSVTRALRRLDRPFVLILCSRDLDLQVLRVRARTRAPGRVPSPSCLAGRRKRTICGHFAPCFWTPFRPDHRLAPPNPAKRVHIQKVIGSRFKSAALPRSSFLLVTQGTFPAFCLAGRR